MKRLVVLITCCLLFAVSFQVCSKTKKRRRRHRRRSTRRIKNYSKLQLPREKFFYYTPNMMNHNFTGYEFGFFTRKKIKWAGYPYNAFASFIINHEQYKDDRNLSAGALGFKGGVLLPTQPWIPFFLQLSVGFAKTALHKDPFFGKREQSIYTSDIFFYEFGAVCRYKKIIIKLSYRDRTVDYFYKKLFLSIGVNF
jgi:hypothetical protein